MLKDDARRIQDRVREIADAVKGLSSPLDFSACEISSLVSTVFRSVSVLAHERSVTLATENLELLPMIVVDPRRIYNALYNLMNNAIAEVPAGGVVTVRGKVLPEESAIVISVIDTGQGMLPEIRDRLFTKRVVSTKAGGTGLGTKIVKDVVDAHGGTVWAESDIGKGTTIHIRLPISPIGIPAAGTAKVHVH
jgi:signal transduction histidine kinase